MACNPPPDCNVNTPTQPLHQGTGMSRHDVNAISGILGIYLLGIFLAWYISGILQPPMPEGIVAGSAVGAVLQTLTTIIIPFTWIITRLGLSLGDLGITTRKLGKTLLLGCLLYSLALAAFIHCSNDPFIADHSVRKLPFMEAYGMLSCMALIAAGTDIATRGYLLLGLSRYTHVAFAIIVQNLFWYLGHIHEIQKLTDCLGFPGALGLTLTLGVLGDVIALKTRNVLGLAIAHILLNIVLVIYIRTL